IPDLFMRMRPTLASLIPGRPMHPQVAALKRWVRQALVGWVLLTLLVIAFLYLALVLAAPRLLGTARLSISTHASALAAAVRHGDGALGVLNAGELILLALPVVALTLTTWMTVRRLARWWWHAGRPRPALRVRAGLVALAAAVTAAASVATPAPY